MTPTTYQKPEIRDANDNIIQQGSFGKNTALSNATNDGWIDYVANDLEALNDGKASTASPAFTGNPTAPTQPTNNNSTRIATTEFVNNELKANTMLLTDTFATAIPSGADLNDYKTAGTYISSSSSTTNSLSNCPISSVGFKLMVCYNGYGSIIYGGEQIIFAQNSVWMRYWSGSLDTGSWSVWKHFAYTEEVLPLGGGTMTGNIALNGAMIVNSADNTFTTVCGGTDDSGSYLRIHGKNSTYAGLVGLSAGDGTNRVTLLCSPDGSLSWGGNNILTASNYNSYALPLSGGTITGDVFAPTPATNDNSTKIATTAFVTNDLKQKAMLLTDTLATVFPSGADLNNYKTAGTYISNSSSLTNSLSNCPISSVGFKMMVIYVGYNSIAFGGTQIIFATTGIFARRNSSSADNVTWGAWKTIVSY